MDTIFNRKKLKPQPRQSSFSTQDLNQRSVPYDKLAPSPRSPLAVATLSQGLSGTSHISAPITNPTLTSNGTEFNIYSLQRAKPDRKAAYSNNSNDYGPPTSPISSLFSTDSSTTYSDSTASSSVGRPSYAPSFRNLRKSEASPTSDPPTSSIADFGQFSARHNPPLSFVTSPGATIRPASNNTTRSDSTNGSRYSPTVISETQSHFSHLSHFHLSNRYDDFQFPRPETDEEIDALFETLKRTRDFPDMPNLSMDQKWHMVYSDEQIRWKDEQAKRQTLSGQNTSVVDGAPEWYIKKFLDKTITAKQAGSLLISLRSKEMRYDFFPRSHLVCCF